MVRKHSSWILAVVTLMTAPVFGQAQRFIAVLDTTQSSWSTTRRCVCYYDPDSPGFTNTTPGLLKPSFVVFVGYEQTSPSKNYEDPGAIAINPANGDTYVLAFDSSSDSGPIPETPADYDLYRINFQSVYNHWVNTRNKTYTYYYANTGNYDTAVPSADRVQLSGCISKIGEVARNQGKNITPYHDYVLEFVNETTLLLLDDQIGEDCDPSPCELDSIANDHVIRSLVRVSTSPGQATYNSTTNEGGYNNSTTESWESKILARVNQDANGNGLDTVEGVPTGRAEPVDMAYYKDATNNVEGVWILESDGGGDDLAFLQITNYNGTAGNVYRGQYVGSGPNYPISFKLDQDPCVDPSANDGSGDWIRVDSRGNLWVGVSGFYNVPPTEPAFIKRYINGYDNGSGQILVGGWVCKGPLDMAVLPDDDIAVTHGWFVALDEWLDQLYIFDAEKSEDIAPGAASTAVTTDTYMRNTVTGASSNINMDGINHFTDRNGIRLFRYPTCSAPTIVSVSPATSGNVGTAGVTITGTNFAAGQTWVSLQKAGAEVIFASNVVVSSSTSLTCDFSMWGREVGTYDVIVTTSCNPAQARLTGGFTITCAAPTVTDITPNTAASGTNPASVVITGTNFLFYGQYTVLRKAGELDIPASNVWVATDHLSMTADFDLTGAAEGQWDVVVTTCDEGVLIGGFTVGSGTNCNTPKMDTNGDQHVDATDFDTFSACYNGPTNAPRGDCACLDSNGDSHVDATDFDVFSACYNGPTNAPRCAE